MEIDKWESLVVPVINCARCNKDHKKIEFYSFQIPMGEYTHWGRCPVSGDPILLKVTFDGNIA